MNIRSFINLFEEIPDINIKSESTCPAGYIHTLSMNEHELYMSDGKPKFRVFSGNNIISRISILSNGKFVLHVEGFHEEDKPVQLHEILQCIVLGYRHGDSRYKKAIFYITNYDMECITSNGDFPKFFISHPEFLDRNVMAMSYNITGEGSRNMVVNIGIRLDHDIDGIFTF